MTICMLNSIVSLVFFVAVIWYLRVQLKHRDEKHKVLRDEIDTLGQRCDNLTKRVDSFPNGLPGTLQDLECRLRDFWDDLSKLSDQVSKLGKPIPDSTKSKDAFGVQMPLAGKPLVNATQERNVQERYRKVDEIRDKIVRKCIDVHTSYGKNISAEEESYVLDRIWTDAHEGRYAYGICVARDWDKSMEDAVKRIVNGVCKDEHIGFLAKWVRKRGNEDQFYYVFGFGGRGGWPIADH